MKYNKTDLAKVFQDLGAMEKVEDIRVKVAEIQKDLVSDYEEHETIVAQNNQYQADIQDLQKTNLKLFKMVGSPVDPSKDKTPGKEPEDDDKPLKYENLFNKEGELI